jgi:hypothetical protein
VNHMVVKFLPPLFLALLVTLLNTQQLNKT